MRLFYHCLSHWCCSLVVSLIQFCMCSFMQVHRRWQQALLICTHWTKVQFLRGLRVKYKQIPSRNKSMYTTYTFSLRLVQWTQWPSWSNGTVIKFVEWRFERISVSTWSSVQACLFLHATSRLNMCKCSTCTLAPRSEQRCSSLQDTRLEAGGTVNETWC